MSDDAEQTVYHVAFAFQLATEILIDLFTFFSLPAPYARLFNPFDGSFPPFSTAAGCCYR